MQEMLWGLLGVAVGLALWLGGGYCERKKREAKPSAAAPLSAEEQVAVQKALRERYNFLNFEGDEMK